MSEVKSAAERYWVIYYLVYLAVAGAGLWQYWPRLLWYWRQPVLQDDSIYLLAAIFGAAAGTALSTAIILEVSGRMVLLIPATVRKIKAQGHAEGKVEGREEGIEVGRDKGRAEERQRINAAFAELDIPEGDEGPIVLDRAKFRKIMNGDAQGKP